MPIQEVNIENHPVIDSDEETFIFGAYEVKINGEYCGCPVVDAGINSVTYDEFIDKFDDKVREEVDARGSNSDITDVAKETENIITFSNIPGGMLTETAAKRVIERLTRFDPTVVVEPTEKQKQAAQQACVVSAQLGWHDIIPDEENRHWY